MRLESPNLEVGSPEWNGAAAKFVGSMRLVVSPGNPATPPDEADVAIHVSATDIRCRNPSQLPSCGTSNQAAGADYVGELEGRLRP